MQPKKFHPAKVGFAIFLIFLVATFGAQPAQARKFKVLHTFHGAPHDGAFPETQLIQDAHGNLYGTTGEGGNGKGVCVSFFGGCGTAFKLDRNGTRIWQHSFNSTNGTGPMAGLLRDKAGNLYGTTLLGGDTNCYQYGCGTVFKLDKAGKETVLHRFHGTPDGWFPEALLVEGGGGSLYGTTTNGGAFDNAGTVFQIDSKGNEIVIYDFCSEKDCTDGNTPSAGVILDKDGNIFGVTASGGASGYGEVFELNANGTLTVLYDFSGGSDGIGPSSVLLADAAGNLYGTTQGGGNFQGVCAGLGCGVIFKLSPGRDGTWSEATLYRFSGKDGNRPKQGPLVQDLAGNLYGTTIFGGTSSNCSGEGCGVVFKLSPKGKETVLHSFTGGADGGVPAAGVMIDESGNIYGTAVGGGDLSCAIGSGQGCGVVFKLTP